MINNFKGGPLRNSLLGSGRPLSPWNVLHEPKSILMKLLTSQIQLHWFPEMGTEPFIPRLDVERQQNFCENQQLLSNKVCIIYISLWFFWPIVCLVDFLTDAFELRPQKQEFTVFFEETTSLCQGRFLIWKVWPLQSFHPHSPLSPKSPGTHTAPS